MRLALLTAAAPYRVDADTVRAAADAGLAPEALLTLVAWAASVAARRIAGGGVGLTVG